MPTPAKQQKIDELSDIFSRAKSALLAHYHGISAEDMTALRAHMRERAVDFRVIKNTLAQKAAKNTPLEVLENDFKGPVSLIVSFDDAVAPAKALSPAWCASKLGNPFHPGSIKYFKDAGLMN